MDDGTRMWLLIALAGAAVALGAVFSWSTPDTAPPDVRIAPPYTHEPLSKNARIANERYCRIENTTDGPVDLTGWSVIHNDLHTYPFPDGFTIPAKAVAVIYIGCAPDTPASLHWCSMQSLWGSRSWKTTLHDREGNDVHEIHSLEKPGCQSCGD